MTSETGEPLFARPTCLSFLSSFSSFIKNMASTSDLKRGAVLRHQNDMWVIGDTKFVNPGKGAAFTRAKLKSLTTGKTVEVTYKSGESVDIIEVEHKTIQFLYHSGAFYTFMNQETYENYDVDADTLGEDAKYLKDGLDVHAVMFEDRIVAVQLPPKVQYKVADAPPAVKGDTATGRVLKDVTLENGLVVRAPMFINPGETILVSTETGEYCERINS